MRTFLDIANSVFGQLGDVVLTEANFNSGTTVEPAFAREYLLRAYRELADSGHSDFRETFTFSTVIGQNEYDLSFPLPDIDNESLRIITAGTDDPWLGYTTEKEILKVYPDVSDLPSGQPIMWWIKTTNSEAVKKLAFDVIPDAVYVIEGIKKLDPNSITSIVATDTTLCNSKGDRALEDYLYWQKRYLDGQCSLNEKNMEILKSKSKYFASPTNQEGVPYIQLPKQESRTSSMQQSASGRVWFWN